MHFFSLEKSSTTPPSALRSSLSAPFLFSVLQHNDYKQARLTEWRSGHPGSDSSNISLVLPDRQYRLLSAVKLFASAFHVIVPSTFLSLPASDWNREPP